ncbi:MAG: hypothetical protein EHM14_02025 [Methanothrix sp.]|nr:MAG: hypothetical protein EHM14_02025 [Methanothrix sp.]
MNNLKLGILQKETLYLKLGLSVCFLLTLLSLIIIERSPAKGYEISIYSNTPVLVWISLIFGESIGIAVIIYSSFKKIKGNWWIIGFFLIILDNFIFISLAGLRGYIYYAGSDSFFHISEIELINQNGYLTNNNYPVIHILASELSEMALISPPDIARYLPAFLSVIFLNIFIFLLAGELVPDKKVAILASATSSVMLFNNLHVQIYPHFFSTIMFSLFFYIYFKSKRKKSLELILIQLLLLLVFPFSHPSSSLALIFILFALTLAEIAYCKQYNLDLSIRDMSINSILFSLIILIMWVMASRLFDSGINNILGNILQPWQNGQLNVAVEIASNLTFVESLEYFLKMYGDTLVCIFASIMFSSFIIFKFANKIKIDKYVFFLSIMILITIPIEYFFFFGVKIQAIGRLLNLLYALIFAPIALGCLLKDNYTNKGIFFSSLLILFLLIVSILSIYSSPWTYSASWHVTDMDVTGSSWLLNNKNPDLLVDPMALSLFLVPGKYGLIPEHFGYDFHNKSLRDSFSQKCYICITKRCKLINLYPVLVKAKLNLKGGWGFNADDFLKLEEDPSVLKLYSNGEFYSTAIL